MTNIAGAGSSFTPSFSADGRYIVFVSHANNLVTNDNLAPYLDVFVRDLLADSTTLVSVNSSGKGGGNGNSNYPIISSNGQWVAFSSEAEDLVANDTNQLSDVFVRDLTSGVTALVSVNLGTASGFPGSSVFRGSSRPTITPDGRYVVFESTLFDLVANDTNLISDLFVRDLQTGTTRLLSVDAKRWPPPLTARSHSAAITPDGRRVAFISTATNLVPNVTNILGEVYVRDLQSEVTLWASANVAAYFAGLSNGFACLNPVISADGRFVAFKASSPDVSNLVYLFYHDLDTGMTTALTSNTWALTWPAMSADGRLIASEDSTNLHVWDAQSGTNLLVSVNALGTAAANGISRTPVITPDVRTVAFLSTATDLTANLNFSTESGFQVYVRDLMSGITRLASVDLNGEPGGHDLEGTIPALAAVGGKVAFESLADNLVPHDENRAYDVFVRDLEETATRLVSQRHELRRARTTIASSRAALNCISADGHIVAFTSFDNEWLPGDTNWLEDVFAKDLASGSILPVSVDTSGVFSTNYMARIPVISANGRYVLFHWQTNSDYIGSFSSPNWLFRRDLLTGVTEQVDPRPTYDPSVNTIEPLFFVVPSISADGRLVTYRADADIYLRDMNTNTNRLISANRFNNGGGGDYSSFNPVFSLDNNWVAFESRATILTTNSLRSRTNLFARDLSANRTILISLDGSKVGLAGSSTGAVFAPSGRHLFFHNAYGTFPTSVVDGYVFDFATRDAPALACTNCLNLRPSSDGRFMAFERKRRLRFFATNDIWLKDFQTGEERMLTVDRTGQNRGNETSTSPSISPDGRFVVFASKASDLVANDTNNAADIFVHDRLQGYNMLVSRNRQGTASGNGVSSTAVMSADGRTVVFHSFASDLVEGDYNEKYDVFVLRLGTGDSDNDGMDDDWEAAYFGNLSRNGSGDFDGDGQTDLQEFIAGTDPTNTNSIFRVLTVSSPGSGSATILWSATTGKSYLVQFKDNLEATSWANLGGIVVASGPTASQIDPAAELHRFYRVVLVP